jgi:hypothetical protein|mmetsp:Transcript_20450/g.27639  ORF Transcript_20450/g.27639 Transcript_20450/m.27639 type:complete len:95 (+) Transcript_20450:248-532(+)
MQLHLERQFFDAMVLNLFILGLVRPCCDPWCLLLQSLIQLFQCAELLDFGVDYFAELISLGVPDNDDRRWLLDRVSFFEARIYTRTMLFFELAM